MTGISITDDDVIGLAVDLQCPIGLTPEENYLGIIRFLVDELGEYESVSILHEEILLEVERRSKLQTTLAIINMYKVIALADSD